LPFARLHVFLVGGIGFAVCVATAWALSFTPQMKRREIDE